ncbi:MAG: phosphoribosyl-AMP cyclohydrolase [Spirochaetes bacterium]|nr:phosphoribosyl-AMP cyclohydrolase [Spirochaetota bacterium]
MLKLDFKKQNGLIPVIAQDHKSGKILMLAFMNKESYQKTLETGKVHYYSRSRDKLWLKGEQSGHFQIVKEIFTDCDQDSLLITIEQIGKAACHKGYESCFYQKYNAKKKDYEIVDEKIFDPDKVYK